MFNYASLQQLNSRKKSFSSVNIYERWYAVIHMCMQINLQHVFKMSAVTTNCQESML